MVDKITEVEAFNGISNWLSQSASKSPATPVSDPVRETPGFRPTVAGDFYYRNRHFNAFALSLVVCCGMYGIYTPEDTAQVLSQLQHLPSPKHIPANDIKGVLQKVVLENSTAYQTLKATPRESSLVRGILAPMVAAKCEPMRSFFDENGDEFRPTWYPRSAGRGPRRIPLTIRRALPSAPAEEVKNEDSACTHSESNKEEKNEDDSTRWRILRRV